MRVDQSQIVPTYHQTPHMHFMAWWISHVSTHAWHITSHKRIYACWVSQAVSCDFRNYMMLYALVRITRTKLSCARISWSIAARAMAALRQSTSAYIVAACGYTWNDHQSAIAALCVHDMFVSRASLVLQCDTQQQQIQWFRMHPCVAKSNIRFRFTCACHSITSTHCPCSHHKQLSLRRKTDSPHPRTAIIHVLRRICAWRILPHGCPIRVVVVRVCLFRDADVGMQPHWLCFVGASCARKVVQQSTWRQHQQPQHLHSYKSHTRMHMHKHT